MKAIIISEPGGPEVLKVEERPIPTIGENEVLIRVKSAGVNRPDIVQRMGNYPAPPGAPPDIPGLEVSGEIEKVGQNVIRWKVGDAVCALLTGGGYAEYVNVPESQCLPIPHHLTFEEAASLPETFFTVWSNVFDRAKFQRGEKFLVHGGTSGIGVAAIQMVKVMGGKVFATAGSDEKCDFITSLRGIAINYKTQDFEKVIKESGGGVDVILDMVGGEYTSKNINVLNPDGRLVIINAMKGRMAEVDLMKVMVKRLLITGSTLRARDSQFKGEIARKLEAHIWPFLESGEIKPIVFKTFKLSEASAAHELMESSQHIGKIVLTV